MTQFSSSGPRELLVNNQHGNSLFFKHSIFPVSFKVALLSTLSGGPLLPETFAKHPKRCVWQKAMQTGQRELAGLWTVLVQPRPKLLRFDSDLASCCLNLFTKQNLTWLSVESGAKHPGLNPGSTYLNVSPSASYSTTWNLSALIQKTGSKTRAYPEKQGKSRRFSCFWLCGKSSKSISLLAENLLEKKKILSMFSHFY